MEPYRILVVEDDPDINGLLVAICTREGYQTRGAFSGSEALLLLEQNPFDLLLLDLMLPGYTGEELIVRVRETQNMPILVLSAKTGQSDRIDVLRLGADDFIPKPFYNQEVVARIEAHLRRYKEWSRPETPKELVHKQLVLNKDAASAHVKGVPLPLTARELSILALLMEYPQKVFTRANLFETVWEDPFLGDENTVNVHISNIRMKIARITPEEYIKTVWGIGFKMSEERTEE